LTEENWLIDSGVYLPAFESHMQGVATLGSLDWGGVVNRYRGTQCLVDCLLICSAIEVYTKAVETLVELASLQVCWIMWHALTCVRQLL
jgi:hypothetical protein